MSADFSNRWARVAMCTSLLLIGAFGSAVAVEKKEALPLCPSAAHKAYACAYTYCYGDKKNKSSKKIKELRCPDRSKVTPHCPICEHESAACNHAIRKAINSKPMDPGYSMCQ